MLVASQLTARIDGRTLYDQLELVVERGECVVVSGPSGCGKSTLLRQLAGLIDAPGARLELDGIGADAMGWPMWRRRVRHCGQRAALPSGTPSDWLDEILSWALWRDAAPEVVGQAKALGAACGLTESHWSRAWAALSGGEAQRVHLAIGLVLPADVLLLDEPTSALDGVARAEVEAVLRGRSTVWVTHDDAQAARVADRVLRLGGEP